MSTDTATALRQWVVKNVIFVLVLAAILFGFAGRLDWAGGWIYLAMTLFIQVTKALVLSPELRAERSQPREGTKRWDLVLSTSMALWGPLILYVVAALDARYGWTAQLPVAVIVLATLVALISALSITWAMRSNPFFSSTVRIQEERGHQVVSAGPYRLVRHPGYLGVAIHDLAMPLVFGSLWAYIPVALLLIIIVIRTALEDRTLQAELPGYREYAQTVRYRLLPGVW